MGNLVGYAYLVNTLFLGADVQVYLYRLLIPMSPRAVLVALTIAVAVLSVADLLIQRMAMNSMPEQVMRTIESAPASIDVLAIGNSLIAAGFNPSVIERTWRESGHPCVAVNCGLGATGVIEHLALARLALRRHNVKTLVYGFFDQQMSSDLIDNNSDIIGNRNILYYLEPQLTLEYARFNTLDRLSFQVYRSSALLRERSSIWAKIEKLRRELGSIGMPLEETNQFGRKTDFGLLEAADSQAFLRSCEKVIRSNDFISAPVQALLQQAREHGVKVVAVEMPMNPQHVKRFYDQPIWQEFRAKTRLAVESTGATYMNASAWIPEEGLFADHLHLSGEGAKQFSQLLAKHLVQQPN